MAYVPPHMRKGSRVRSPTGEMAFLPRFRKSLDLGSPGQKPGCGYIKKFSYADNAITKWFAVGLNGLEVDLGNLVLQQAALEIIERQGGVKPFVLLNLSHHDDGKVNQDISRLPWKCISQRVLQDLIHCSEYVRNEIEGPNQNLKGIRSRLVARIGKIFFIPWKSCTPEEDLGKASVDEFYLGKLKKCFYTGVPASYVDAIVDEVVPKVGFEFRNLKDIYHVKLSDRSQQEAVFMCKCRILDNRLQFYKMEMTQVRHMVYNISCIEKNMDLRLMLSTKRTLTSLQDDEMDSIRNLIASSVLCLSSRGGLRWPYGKATSSDGRFSVIGVWHTICRVYESPLLYLKVRDADRYDFSTDIGETTREVNLSLKGLLSQLLEKVENDKVLTTLEDVLKLLWEHFLPSNAIQNLKDLP
ncbi:hypothetical protein SAY86_021672 [Trapa natans]|uniref:DUF7903 domain-containing protein n=1 Tax=Trapa natans TaxID=22666 RepID=A0AAN7RFT4_TRANT|nr:hypothetical protein SAY86_021672 [Trapa natans]